MLITGVSFSISFKFLSKDETDEIFASKRNSHFGSLSFVLIYFAYFSALNSKKNKENFRLSKFMLGLGDCLGEKSHGTCRK